jgi:hypothetical protein
MDKDELVDAVKAHARQHYDKNGWDYVVETMSDADILREIGKASTTHSAIRNVGKTVKLWHEQRQDVQATEW